MVQYSNPVFQALQFVILRFQPLFFSVSLSGNYLTFQIQKYTSNLGHELELFVRTLSVHILALAM